MTSDRLPVRGRLLAEAIKFVKKARRLPEVRRIALLGSILTDKSEPKDIDLLVWIDGTAELGPLATLARRLQGHLQSLGRGADVFLADEGGQYLGRTCPWKECRPGLRARCDATHCGRRPHLHDDLEVIALASDLVLTPPLELWPEIKRRCSVPADVENILAQLEGDAEREGSR